MKPILPGGRGAAVEDIQRRLLALGHDLGPTGVDGVFLGCTQEAVVRFQREYELSEDGIVGNETWSALVDATFTLGDRMLYLRLPFFHGYDVRVLQEALSSLGFSCGAVDGIFGRFTEQAVREFQRNSGLPADGVVGLDTVRTVERLRHVWEGKSQLSRSPVCATSARVREVLSAASVEIGGDEGVAADVASRAVNLALASDPTPRVVFGEEGGGVADIVLSLTVEAAGRPPDGPVVAVDAGDPDTFAIRLRAAVEARTGSEVITVELPAASLDEREAQRYAVLVMDALCAALV